MVIFFAAVTKNGTIELCNRTGYGDVVVAAAAAVAALTGGDLPGGPYLNT